MESRSGSTLSPTRCCSDSPAALAARRVSARCSALTPRDASPSSCEAGRGGGVGLRGRVGWDGCLCKFGIGCGMGWYGVETPAGLG